MTISNFSGDLFFLDPTYPFPVDFEGVSYSCMYSALVGSLYTVAKDKNKIAHMDAYDALRHRPGHSYVPDEVARSIIMAKFEDIDGYISQKLSSVAPANATYHYENTIHDNYLGICTCKRCRAGKVQSKDLLGRIITELRRTTD